MKTFNRCGAQGDCLIIAINELPDDAIKQEAENGNHIVAHSETNHHHVLPEQGVNIFQSANDPFMLYAVIEDEYADLTHLRSFDTHETLRIKKGIYEIRKQREYTPEGWRRVAD